MPATHASKTPKPSLPSAVTSRPSTPQQNTARPTTPALSQMTTPMPATRRPSNVARPAIPQPIPPRPNAPRPATPKPRASAAVTPRSTPTTPTVNAPRPLVSNPNIPRATTPRPASPTASRPSPTKPTAPSSRTSVPTSSTSPPAIPNSSNPTMHRAAPPRRTAAQPALSGANTVGPGAIGSRIDRSIAPNTHVSLRHTPEPNTPKSLHFLPNAARSAVRTVIPDKVKIETKGLGPPPPPPPGGGGPPPPGGNGDRRDGPPKSVPSSKRDIPQATRDKWQSIKQERAAQARSEEPAVRARAAMARLGPKTTKDQWKYEYEKARATAPDTSEKLERTAMERLGPHTTREEWKTAYSKRRAIRTVWQADKPLENSHPKATKDGHGHARHGYHTTDDQQARRIRDGTTPDGKKGQKVGIASRFISPEAEAEALGRGRRKLRIDLKNGGVKPPRDATGNPIYTDSTGFPFRPTTSVTTNRKDGFGKAVIKENKAGQIKVKEDPTLKSKATLVWEYALSTGEWNPVTYHPD